MGQCPRFAVHIEKINEKIKEKPTKKKKLPRFFGELPMEKKTRKPTTHIKQETVF